MAQEEILVMVLLLARYWEEAFRTQQQDVLLALPHHVVVLLRFQSDGSMWVKPEILKGSPLTLTCTIVSHLIHEAGDPDKRSYYWAVHIWLHIRVTWRAFTMPVPKS